jgi:hypothetical protein
MGFGISGADDVQIAIERTKEGIVRSTIEHMKDGPAGDVIASKLEKVDLGTDREGDPLSSCIIVPADNVAAGVKLSKAQAIALEALQTVLATEPVPPPSELKLPASTKVCHSDSWRKQFYAKYPADKTAAKKKALFRATLDLMDIKLIELFKEFVWLRDKQDEGTS